jgi:2-C-methyl-D-erythritol 4-phosphate cytidylyltransferase
VSGTPATAVIAAAGSGERLGAGGPKAFVELAGEPLLAHALRAAEAAAAIGPLVVAAPPGEEARALRCGRAAAGREPVVVSGGATRAQSVAAALAAVETELVLIHDAARPLAAPALFDAVAGHLRAGSPAAAVIAAAPIADTVKRVAPGEALRVVATEPREQLWAAQTPQGFRTRELREAIAALGEEAVAAATDEARLIELTGGTVLLEPAPARNLKVTTPEDLALAEALLAAPSRV